MNSTNENVENLPSRRNFILGALAVTLSSASIEASAAAKGHHHHHHGPAKHAGLLNAAMDCVKKGKLCKGHCIELIKVGDTSIGDCLEAVIDTISMCETLAQLAVSDSRHLKSFAKVCIEVCKDCEKECRAHKDKHKECKACMESCENCIKELEKIIA